MQQSPTGTDCARPPPIHNHAYLRRLRTTILANSRCSGSLIGCRRPLQAPPIATAIANGHSVESPTVSMQDSLVDRTTCATRAIHNKPRWSSSVYLLAGCMAAAAAAAATGRREEPSFRGLAAQGRIPLSVCCWTGKDKQAANAFDNACVRGSEIHTRGWPASWHHRVFPGRMHRCRTVTRSVLVRPLLPDVVCTSSSGAVVQESSRACIVGLMFVLFRCCDRPNSYHLPSTWCNDVRQRSGLT